MLTPADAEKLISEAMPAWPTEDCPIAEAHGRILRADLSADRDLPPFDRATMDGYALRSSSLGNIATFRSQGTQAAGQRRLTLESGADVCIEIMTGAVLPEGADCIIPYEETSKDGERVRVLAPESFSAGNAIHRRGSDHMADSLIVRAGTRLGGREIAVAASCGQAVVRVAHRPKIAVIASGDELVDVGSAVAPHQIRRSNDYALRASLIGAGFSRVERFHLRDVKEEIAARLRQILADFDVVLLTGGVSKGKFDFLPGVLEELGVRKIFHGVAQRPGKPFWFGQSARQTPVFALPGNPVSALTCLHRYVLPALARASGQTENPPRMAALATAFTFRPPLACLLPVKLSSGPRAELLATPGAVNTSGDFAGLIGTDGFIELPAEQNEFPAGYLAPFWAWC